MDKTKTLPPIKLSDAIKLPDARRLPDGTIFRPDGTFLLPDGTIFRSIGVIPRRVVVPPKPDWDFWRQIPDIKFWQAIALSMDIDPDSLRYSRGIWNGLPNNAYQKEFKKRMRILQANALPIGMQDLEDQTNHWVPTLLFSRWAQNKGWDIPPEIMALASMYVKVSAPGAKVEAAPGAKVEAAPVVKVSAPGAKVEAAPSEETADDDQDEILAALFDPVPVEALEKMFPANGDKKWKNWAEKAKRNGLIDARIGRAKFNPYKAGVWFVRKGMDGWDDARLSRTLANNLPARSRDNARLLTGNID